MTGRGKRTRVSNNVPSGTRVSAATRRVLRQCDVCFGSVMQLRKLTHRCSYPRVNGRCIADDLETLMHIIGNRFYRGRPLPNALLVEKVPNNSTWLLYGHVPSGTSLNDLQG